MKSEAEDQASRRLVVTTLLATVTSPDGDSATLQTASAELQSLGCCEIGVWDAGPGTDTDVEGDEVFVVLEGRGRVIFDDGSHINLRPGVLVRLHSGDRTTWEITDRLRKLYVVAVEEGRENSSFA